LGRGVVRTKHHCQWAHGLCVGRHKLRWDMMLFTLVSKKKPVVFQTIRGVKPAHYATWPRPANGREKAATFLLRFLCPKFTPGRSPNPPFFRKIGQKTVPTTPSSDRRRRMLGQHWSPPIGKVQCWPDKGVRQSEKMNVAPTTSPADRKRGMLGQQRGPPIGGDECWANIGVRRSEKSNVEPTKSSADRKRALSARH
jgi:hypothetical protein